MQVLESPRKFEGLSQERHDLLLPLESSIGGRLSMSAELVDADLGWRGFLAKIGVSAVVVSYACDSGDVGRQAFLVGFENARSTPVLVRSLIAYCERIWKSSEPSTFWSYRISGQALMDAVPAEGVVQRSLNHAAMMPLLQQFEHAAVARHSAPGAKVQALLFRKHGDGEFTQECRQSIVHVLPLLMQSAGTYVTAKREQRRSAQLEAMFDKVSLSTLLVDADGRPIFCNDAARLMLSERNWLIQCSDGTIACKNAALSKQWKAAIRAVTTIGDFASTETVIRLDNEDGDWRLAFIIPAVSRFRDESSRCAMVLVHTPARAAASAQLLSALGLLPSEQRFLSSFLRTSSLSEAANETGVSAETARTYLKRVRAKLGVHRQMDLAGLISGLVPPIRRKTSASAQ